MLELVHHLTHLALLPFNKERGETKNETCND